MSQTHTRPAGAAHPDWSAVKAIIMDADGTITDGGIYIDDRGCEFKRFDVRDGLGISLWHLAGGKTGVITGRRGLSLAHRLRELRIHAVEQGASDKVAAFGRITAQLGVAPGECAFVGDDLPDLCVMKRAGVPVAVAGSPSEVAAVAMHTTRAHGGHGAVRELIETILRAQGRWEQVVSQWTEGCTTIIQQ